MTHDGDIKIHIKDNVLRNEAVGEVIIGSVNPVAISKEDFLNNPELLHHGAGKEFVFRRDYDYQTEQRVSIHSHTVGKGFYTTPNLNDAQLFSEAFGAESPIIVSILPYQAKMFDFRTKDLEHNAKVPKEMFKDYYNSLKADYEKKWGGYDPTEDNEFVTSHPADEPDEEKRANPTTFEDMFATKPTADFEESSKRIKRLHDYTDEYNYLTILGSKIKSRADVDLREMLALLGDPKNREYASKIFRDFMRSQGYDGIIYLEGGDHPDQVKPASFVFYNLDKIGTYETWNPDN